MKRKVVQQNKQNTELPLWENNRDQNKEFNELIISMLKVYHREKKLPAFNLFHSIADLVHLLTTNKYLADFLTNNDLGKQIIADLLNNETLNQALLKFKYNMASELNQRSRRAKITYVVNKPDYNIARFLALLILVTVNVLIYTGFIFTQEDGKPNFNLAFKVKCANYSIALLLAGLKAYGLFYSAPLAADTLTDHENIINQIREKINRSTVDKIQQRGYEKWMKHCIWHETAMNPIPPFTPAEEAEAANPTQMQAHTH